MGTGKSSVGRIIAEELEFKFLDTDELIQERLGMLISEVFARQGEPFFRRYEREIVKELATEHNLIISTGGGLSANSENLVSLKQHSLVVCLWASPETIFERIRHQTHRPLLQTADPLNKIRELLAVREPFYRQADLLVQTGLRPPKEIAQHIIHQFNMERKNGI
jgi:shikimate kinase